MLLTKSIKHRYKKKMLGVLAITALAFSSAVHAEHVKVFLLAGQSNMDGRALAELLPTDYVSPYGDALSAVNLQNAQTDVLFYRNSTLMNLQPDTFSNIATKDAFGPEITFGRTIADALPDENIALIKVATGGTSLWASPDRTNWAPHDAVLNPKGTMYGKLNTQVTSGLAAIQNGGVNTTEIVGMLWTQGEADAFDSRTATQYQTDLNSLISRVRTDYGSDLSFFMSGVPRGGESAFAQINTAQSNVATADANAYFIDPSALTLRDTVHYDAASQMTLGESFAQSYLSTVPEPGSLMILGVGGLCLLSRHRRRRGLNWS